MDLYTPPSVAYGGAYAIRPYNWVRAILRNTDAIPRLGTCGPSKNYPVFATVGGVWWGVFNTPLQPGMCDPSKYRCNFPTGYVLSFEKPPRFRPPSGPLVGSMRYAPTIGYVRFFKIPMQCPDRVRTILRNADAIPRLGTCEGSKNGSVFATVGDVWWGVCDTSLRPGMCGPSKNCSVFVPLRGRLWGVFDTPLRPGMCDSSKYRCNSLTGYVRGFKKWICIRHRRWRMVGRIQYAPTTGYVRPFKKLSRFRPLRGRLWGRMRYAPQTGYVRSYEILIRSLDRKGGDFWEVGQ